MNKSEKRMLREVERQRRFVMRKRPLKWWLIKQVENRCIKAGLPFWEADCSYLEGCSIFKVIRDLITCKRDVKRYLKEQEAEQQ